VTEDQNNNLVKEENIQNLEDSTVENKNINTDTIETQ